LLSLFASFLFMAAPAIFDSCTLFGPWPRHAADLSAEALLHGMAQNNISRSLVTSTTGIYYDYRQGNAETLALAKAHPAQLFPVATLDPRAYPECLAEAETRAAEGFRLFRFFPARQNWPIRFAPFCELLHQCDELKVPVAVEISHPGDCTELASATASLRSPLLLAGVTPNLLGEVLAVMREDTRVAEESNRPRSFRLAPFDPDLQTKFYVETTHLLAPNTFEMIRDAVPSGASRLVFASYAPLRYLSAALAPILTSTLSDDDKAAILGGNLKTLLTK